MIIIQLQTYPAKTIFPKPVNQTEPNGTKWNQMAQRECWKFSMKNYKRSIKKDIRIMKN